MSADGAYRPQRSSRMKAISAPTTWILPLDFVDTSTVLDEGEPTASIDQVVERLQSLDVKKACEPILGHGRKLGQAAGWWRGCGYMFGGVSRDSGAAEDPSFHVHALVPGTLLQLALLHLWKFDYQALSSSPLPWYQRGAGHPS